MPKKIPKGQIEVVYKTPEDPIKHLWWGFSAKTGAQTLHKREYFLSLERPVICSNIFGPVSKTSKES